MRLRWPRVHPSRLLRKQRVRGGGAQCQPSCTAYNGKDSSQHAGRQAPSHTLCDQVVRPHPPLLCEYTPYNTQDTDNRCVYRDSEASAPAEFPPEQPEADLQEVDEEEYAADELAEEAEEEAAAEAESKEAVDASGDANMDGTAEAAVAEEDEASDDGSVDLEDESEDDLLEEEEGEDEAADGDDAMEVDEKPAASDKKDVMAH